MLLPRWNPVPWKFIISSFTFFLFLLLFPLPFPLPFLLPSSSSFFCGLWCLDESLNFFYPQFSPQYIVHNNRYLPLLTVQEKRNKSCCTVTSCANSLYLQEDPAWTLHFLHEHTQTRIAVTEQLSACSSSHEEAFQTSSLSGDCLTFRTPSPQSHLLFPSTSLRCD